MSFLLKEMYYLCVMDKLRILFICLGNICRSPAAQGIMQDLVDKENLSQWFVIDSAGIGSWHVGQLADPRMRRHAALRGIQLTHHARCFDAATDLQRFDIIVTMDEDNYKIISRAADGYQGGAEVIRMADFFTQHPEATSVPDPYYGGDKDFELALDLIEDGCRGILKRWKDENHVRGSHEV